MIVAKEEEIQRNCKKLFERRRKLYVRKFVFSNRIIDKCMELTV